MRVNTILGVDRLAEFQNSSFKNYIDGIELE